MQFPAAKNLVSRISFAAKSGTRTKAESEPGRGSAQRYSSDQLHPDFYFSNAIVRALYELDARLGCTLIAIRPE